MLNKNDYKVAIPSRGRAGFITAQTLFNGVPIYLFVNDSKEQETYQKRYKGCKVINCNVSNIVDAHNFIFEYFPQKTKILIACDDVKNISYLDGRTKWTTGKMDAIQVNNLVNLGFNLCEEYQANLWGLNPTISGGIMLKDQISFYTFIVGAFYGVINNPIRFNPSIKRKHDYDFSVQHLMKFGKNVRLDFARTSTDFLNKKGGGNEGTSNDYWGEQSVNYLISAYPKYFRKHPSRINEVLLRFPSKERRFIKCPEAKVWIKNNFDIEMLKKSKEKQLSFI